MEALYALSHSFDNEIIALIISLPRLYAFLQTSGLFSNTTIPGTTRVAVILCLAFLVVPVNIDFAAQFDRSIYTYSILFAKEYGIGFILGYMVGWIFWVLEAAGGLIDNQRGAAIASSIDPLQGHESSTLGNTFSLVFLCYVFITGSVLTILGIFYSSYQIWPPIKPLPLIGKEFPLIILGIFDQAMRMSFVLAAPVLAMMFLAEFSLALISRFAPQIQVFILAMPIKSILAIFILIIYIHVLFPFADQQLSTFPILAQKFYDMMRVGETVLQQRLLPSP